MSSNASECLNEAAFGPGVIGCRDEFDFTTFFEQTLLSITPSACFELLALVRIGYLIRQPSIVLARQFQFLKLAAISVYAAITLALLILISKSPVAYTTTSITAAVLSFVNAICFLGLSALEHTRSLRSSILLNSYLLLSLLFDAIQTRTAWLREPSSTTTVLFTTALGAKFGMLLLESQGKSRWIPKRARSPEVFSGIWSLSFFSWLNSLIIAGYRKILSVEDLFPLDSQLSIDTQRERFHRQWRNFGAKRRLRLLRALLATLKWQLLVPVVPRIAAGGFTFAQPFLINALLSYLQQDRNSRVQDYGYGFIAAGALVYVGIAISRGIHTYLHQRALAVLRACLVSAVYQATMGLDITGGDTSGPLTLMNSDVTAIQDGFQNLHEYWASLIEVLLASWLLQQELGSAFVAPILVVVLSSLAAIGFGEFVGKQQKIWMEAIQKRVSLTASIIPSMVSIKMSGMAPGLQDAVQRWREDELQAASRYRVFTTFTAVIAFTPLLISPVAAFGATNKDVSTTRVFTSLAYISLLCSPLTQLFQTIPHLMAAITSLGRVEEFLDSVSDNRRDARYQDDQTTENLDTSFSTGIELHETIPRPGVAVSIRDGTFGWEQGRSVLNRINLEIPASKLIMITGRVGSGKSTLLKAILEEIPFSEGEVHRSDRQAGFCDQTTFLKNATIRENIIGYAPFEPSWYNRVLTATALDEDIAMFPKKDQSMVGTKGISLSGGQRQRIALARALYTRNKIILLDDVVSGLDHHTEAHIFHQVLAPGGLFYEIGATVILYTPLLRHLAFADYIILLENGTISKQGSFEEIGPDLGVLSIQQEQKMKKGNSDEVTSSSAPPMSPDSAVQMEDKTRQLGDIQAYKYYLSRVGTVSLALFFVFQKRSVLPGAGYKIHLEALTTLFRARLSYLTTVDSGITINIFSQVMSIVDKDLSMNFSNTVLTGLTALGQAAVIASASPYILAGYPILMGVLYVLCRIYLRTSRQLRYLDIETKAPLYSHFLESLNGLATIRAFGWVSHSIEECHRLLDESQRPDYLLAMIQHWLNLVLNLTVGVLAVIIITFATQLRSSAGFTGVGLVTLMSFGQMGANLVRIYAMLETAIAALSRLKNFTETAPQETTSEGHETIEGSCMASGSVVLDQVSASYEMPGGITQDTLQQSMNNDDRLALRNISLSIADGEKIAICGRSGSGKSSVLLILNRLLEPESGTVILGDRPLSTIDRQTLRAALITLPQTPFYLPEGTTFRQNLDFEESSDENCEYSLRSVGLWDFVVGRGGLDAELKGDALSQGQKQLFSLARAVLRARIASEQRTANRETRTHGGVLLLDEVNSSVDHDTDMLMQEIIRKEFAHYTIICVAHRLEAIRWYDRVIVMDKGTIIESGTVDALLAKSAGIFKGLWLAGRGISDSSDI